MQNTIMYYDSLQFASFLPWTWWKAAFYSHNSHSPAYLAPHNLTEINLHGLCCSIQVRLHFQDESDCILSWTAWGKYHTCILKHWRSNCDLILERHAGNAWNQSAGTKWWKSNFIQHNFDSLGGHISQQRNYRSNTWKHLHSGSRSAKHKQALELHTLKVMIKGLWVLLLIFTDVII